MRNLIIQSGFFLGWSKPFVSVARVMDTGGESQFFFFLDLNHRKTLWTSKIRSFRMVSPQCGPIPRTKSLKLFLSSSVNLSGIKDSSWKDSISPGIIRTSILVFVIRVCQLQGKSETAMSCRVVVEPWSTTKRECRRR